MTPEDFKAWRNGLGYSQKEAAEALGVSYGTVFNYETGKRREDGQPVEIPRTVALACSALFHGLEPWTPR